MTLYTDELRIPQPRGDADQWYGPSFEVQAAAAVAATNANFHPQPEPSWSGVERRRPAPPTKPRTSPLLLIACLGLALSLGLNVELAMMRGTHSASVGPPAVSIGNAAAQLDLSGLARAEANYRVTSSTYTTDNTALNLSGYQPLTGAAVTVYVGIAGAESFCAAAGAVDAAGAAGATWFVYDSSRGGLVDRSYPTEQTAQLACTDAATTGFLSVS